MKQPRTRAKRASYREAVEWIALNDSPGDNDAYSPRWVAVLTTTALIADIFGKPQDEVARDVVRARVKLLKDPA